MVILQEPGGGARVCVRDDEQDGFPEWTVVETLAAMPSETFTPEQQEAVRLGGLSRAELVAEIAARFDGELAKRDVQIAEIATAANVPVTPVTEINGT